MAFRFVAFTLVYPVAHNSLFKSMFVEHFCQRDHFNRALKSSIMHLIFISKLSSLSVVIILMQVYAFCV